WNQEEPVYRAEDLEEGNFFMRIGENSTIRNSTGGDMFPLKNSDNQLVNYSDQIPLFVDEGLIEEVIDRLLFEFTLM
ncbi:hypothetical protein HAX54_004139, partial [Datura stramonium]|nr:hypothetical protein [Datura stramonium]